MSSWFRYILLTVFLFIFADASAQSVNAIAKKIRKGNRVESQSIFEAGEMSMQYLNFMALEKGADEAHLLKFTSDTNMALACYAAMALADKKSKYLSDIFSRFLENNKVVETQIGCIGGTDPVASEIYHRYWNSLHDKQQENDSLLKVLDSIILHKNNVYWLLTNRALENRVYPRLYNRRICYLAFTEKNIDALFYLCDWYRAEYRDTLKVSLINYLQAADFSQEGVGRYYKVLEEIFTFRDESVRKLVIAKMKKDRHWQFEKEHFIALLDEHNIFLSDIESHTR